MNEYDSKEKVYDFLRNHAVAVLSTVSADGTPSASPIYFVPDAQLNLYFITKSDTEKSLNIEGSNNIASITITDSEIPVTIQAKGVVKEIEDPEYFAKIAEANAKQIAGFHWPPPLYKIKGSGYILLYKFEPTWLRVADFSEPAGDDDIFKEVFHEII